jgi:hypothetical protein
MLFDLQSRRRRGAVKVIYLLLAVLMAGGLLLFGIGAGNGGGGFLDIFKGGSSSTQSQVSDAEKAAERRVRLHPQDAQAWYALAYARIQTAGLASNYDATANGGLGGFTASGRAKLETASTAWQRYLKLNPPHPNATLARQMANGYSQTGLDQPANAATAMEIVTEQQPTAQAFGALAQFAYLAAQFRKGDLAAAKAVQLAPSAQKKLYRAQLANSRRQALRQQVPGSVQQGGQNGAG